MRVTLDPSVYVFDPTAATVTFAAGSTRPTHQGQILSIVNTSNEIYLYLPVQSGRGGAYNATTGILTLEIGTATMSSTNALQIVVDNDATPATSALQAAGNTLLSGISDKLPTLDSGRVPVSGTFWPTTQPISGSVTIDGTPSVAISGTAAVSGPLTNTELRATAVPVSGAFWPTTQPVSGPLTDVQLRAQAVPVSGPLTDTQLRAEAVPVSGSVTINAGTNTSTASLALETGGNLATLVDRAPALIGGRSPVLWLPEAPLNTSYSFTGAIALNTVLLTLDCSNSAALSIETSSIGTGGAIAVEWSNSGTFYGSPSLLHENISSTNAARITAAGVLTVPKMGKFAKLRQATASTGGTTSITVAQLSDCPAVTATAQLSAGSAQIGSTITGYSSSAGTAASFASIVAAASTNAASLKSSSGRPLRFSFYNSTAGLAVFKLHNSSAAPTVGTTPVGFRVPVPPGAWRDGGLEGGWAHTTGISMSITANFAENDTTPVAAGAIVGGFWWI